ncbi:MAG: nucleoside-diphosphate kinase [Chthoniobacterales bacterium]|nr:nucleoside-diphosphate kinase [Chthoniobacterales bacterium]
MPEQLTYVLITHRALYKARTGNILSRLLSLSGLDLIGARMFSPSTKLCAALADNFSSQELTSTFLRGSLSQEGNQMLCLLLRGEGAVTIVSNIVGDDERMDGRGETLRDTYGEHVLLHEEEGEEPGMYYFEPAVIAPNSKQGASQGLAILAEFSESDGGILDISTQFPAEAKIEKTLVLIKPDNFDFPNRRPGAVIDLLAHTGLALVGVKIQQMSVAQAKDFYGPVLEVLEAKLPDGRIHWESIIAFMSGARPSELSEKAQALPGNQRCAALIYQGEDAISKIRNVLGPTDPSKAPHGTIRKEFGKDIMMNGAHASDSTESFLRETAIININENNFKSIILSHR